MLVQEIAALIDENKRLKEKLANFWDEVLDLKRDRFGKKSERFVDSNQQQFSFNEIELEKSTDPNAKEDAKETITYIRHKGKQKKKPLPDNLEREVKEIDLPEEEKFCNKDGSPLQEVGVEVTEKLKTYPARHVVVVEKKKKYACPTCSECMKQARAESILPGTIATSELLSYIIFSKFFQGLPLYRLEELLGFPRPELEGFMSSGKN